MAGEQRGWNDLLLPVLLVVAILPFIVYFKEYQSGLARFAWYGIDDTVTDFYTYYKSRFLIWIGVACTIVLLFRLPLYPEKRKRLKPFVPLFVYALLVVVSALLSVDKGLSLTGAPYMYENVFVLLTYVAVCFYTYQVMETDKDYKAVHRAVCVMLCGMLVIGLFQVAGRDLLNMEGVQRLVMNKEDEALYLGTFEDVFTRSYVYLMTMNPNYAGHFLAMALTYILAFLFTEKDKKYRIAYGCLFVVLFVLLWMTYSRGALVAFAVGVVCACICSGILKKRSKKMLVRAVGITAAACVFAVLLDAAGGFHFLGRMMDAKEEIHLEKITTGERVTIVYDGRTQVIDDLEEGEVRTISLDGRDWNFIRENGVYTYINEFGKYDQIPEIPAVDFKGYEYLGSGRVYIWSRVLPLLSKYFFLGSGPDTFLEAFPQNDYVGKANYSHSVTMYIEKAHNGYLMCWVQTGFPALCCLLIFAAVIWGKGACRLRSKRKTEENSTDDMRGNMKERMQIAALCSVCAYAAGLFFHDSTLFTTPFACVCMGIVAAGEERLSGAKESRMINKKEKR